MCLTLRSQFNHCLPTSNILRLALSLSPNYWASALSSHQSGTEGSEGTRRQLRKGHKRYPGLWTGIRNKLGRARRCTMRPGRFRGCRASSAPRAAREISAAQRSLSHPTGVAPGSVASPPPLHTADLVLEPQPVKMLSRSKTFEKGLPYFVRDRNSASSFFFSFGFFFSFSAGLLC